MPSAFSTSFINSSFLSKLPISFLLAVVLCPFPQYFGASLHAQALPGSFEDLARSATAAREAGNREEAIRGYQHALEIRPDWEEGWWYLGTLEYDDEHFGNAIPALSKVVQLEPSNGPAWNFLGLCEFETGDYANSLEHLQQGQELGAQDDIDLARVSKYHLALLLNRNGEFEKAFRILTSSFTDHEPVEVKTALGLSLLRIPLLPREVDPSEDSLLAAAGETASARAPESPAANINSFEQLLKQFPKTPYAHHAFGKFLSSSGRINDALVQEEEETRISPASSLPYIEISSLELRLGKPQSALRAAQSAVEIAPKSAESHRALAICLRAVGQTERASAELRIAEALAPEVPVRETRIIQMYAAKKAAPEFTQATDRDADLTKIAQEAFAAQSAGNVGQAIHIYAQGTQTYPQWDEGWWNLGTLDYATGNYLDAISTLKKYVGIKPDNGTAWAVMGLSEFELEDYDNSLIHLERGEELGMRGSKESVQLAKYRLGVLRNRKGEFEHARQILGPEADSGPLAREAQFALGMSLLHIALLPGQVEPSKHAFVTSAGEAATLLQQSKYDDALSKMKDLLRDHPSVPFLHYAYGTALADLSRYDEAEPQLRQETVISPNGELPYLTLASIALKTRRAAEALPLAEHAIKLAPNSAKAHYILGRAYLDLFENEKAIEALGAASKLAPFSPEVHFNLAKAYARVNEAEKAQEERNTFLRLNALAEQQRTNVESDVYTGPRDESDFSLPSQSAGTSPTQAH